MGAFSIFEDVLHGNYINMKTSVKKEYKNIKVLYTKNSHYWETRK